MVKTDGEKRSFEITKCEEQIAIRFRNYENLMLLFEKEESILVFNYYIIFSVLRFK